MRQAGRTIVVTTPVTPAEVGCYVHVTGVFHQSGHLEPVHLHVRRQRRMKMVVSTVPAIWVGILLMLHFRINRRAWCLEVRKHA